MSKQKQRHRMTIDGKKVLHSRYVMEQHLGRKLLRNELVHHINDDSMDDRIENLQIMTPKEHSALHNTGKDNRRWRGGRKVVRRRCDQKHIEKRRAYNREYYQKHKKERQEYGREYYQEHKEELQAYGREYGRKYYQKNREKILEKLRKKRREENG